MSEPQKRRMLAEIDAEWQACLREIGFRKYRMAVIDSEISQLVQQGFALNQQADEARKFEAELAVARAALDKAPAVTDPVPSAVAAPRKPRAKE